MIDKHPNLKLSDTQLVILSKAAQREDRRVEHPAHLRGGAADKVIAALSAKSLIELIPEEPFPRSVIVSNGEQQRPARWRISVTGLAAIGIDDATDDRLENGDPGEPIARIAQAIQHRHASARMPRADSKQLQLTAMLSREEGASISEIATALGWLPHTTRAALTGLRHKGYELGREIGGDRGSLYRIIAMPIAVPDANGAAMSEAA